MTQQKALLEFVAMATIAKKTARLKSSQMANDQIISSLSYCDRDLFLAASDTLELKPNKKLLAAAKRYKKQAKLG